MMDKIYHIFAGIVSAGVLGGPAYHETGNLFAGLWPAIIGGLIVAAGKEYFDYKTDGNTWDWKDFGATCAGVAIVVVAIILLHFSKG